MGRPKTFDETVALDAAIGCFWRRGYEATSVRDLALEMNIPGASLYNAFGDKRQLFKAGLQRYLDLEARRRLSTLDAAPDPIRGLKKFFKDLVASAASSDCGCMLVNSAMEIAPHDSDLATDIRAGLNEIEAGFRGAIGAAQQRGLVPRAESAVDRARLLLAAVIAILVLSRAGVDRLVLESIAKSALAAAVGRGSTQRRRKSTG